MLKSPLDSHLSPVTLLLAVGKSLLCVQEAIGSLFSDLRYLQERLEKANLSLQVSSVASIVSRIREQ